MMQPHEGTILPPLEKGVQKHGAPGDVVFAIGNEMRHLSPGDLATLRHTNQTPMRNAWFWHWENQHGWSDNQDDAWAYIITFMAIITKKGREDGKPSPHKANNAFGKALYDGGEKERPSRPKVSEQRLARLLNARGEKRQDAILRVARMLARNATSLNCEDVAWFLLNEKSDKPAQNIARAYYKQASTAAKQNNTKSGDNKK